MRSTPPHQRSHALDDVRVHSPSQHAQNIDPAIAGSGMMSNSAGESGGDDNGSDSKKGGKRELSTSKRAAQNRAAQVRSTIPQTWIHLIACVICFSSSRRAVAESEDVFS